MKKCEECDIIWGGECSAKDFTVEELTNKFETYTKEIFHKIGCNVQRDSTATKAVKNERKKCAC